ncbi:MAG: hypothetical protein JWP98_988, partial [Edaphobacter sp.]|nr:hypothetical protein [Edaphobacter sp.]
GAVVGALVHGEVGRAGHDLVVLDGGGRGMGVRFSGFELGFLGGDLVEDFLLVELGENLALLELGVDVGVEAGDDSGGLGLDLDLGDGLDLAGGDYRAGDVAALGLGQLGGFEFGAVATSGHGNTEDDDYDEDDKSGPNPEVPFLFALCRQGVAPVDPVSEVSYAGRHGPVPLTG